MAGRYRAQPPGSLIAFAERSPFGQIILVHGHSGALAFKEFLDRAAKPGMDDVMGRPGLHRFIAAREFVPALRPGLDPRQAQPDRQIDCLIITQLEMQERLFN